MIIILPGGTEEYRVQICPRCRNRLYEPGSASFALLVMTSGSCGHDRDGAL